MKKRMLVLLGFLFMTAVLPLPAAARQEYTPQQLLEKVQKREVLHHNQMPMSFVYTEKLSWRDNQADINAFYTAQKLWKQNPRNFAAVFNYGLLIMSNDYGEGLALNDVQIDEAYRVLEQAKKLRPYYKETYELQNYLLDFKLFGPTWIGPGLSDEEMIAGYRAHPDLARKQLGLLQTMFKYWSNETSAWNYQQAALICQSLNRTEAAQAYQTKADFLYKQMEEQEAAAARDRQEAKKGLIYSLKKFISGKRAK